MRWITLGTGILLTALVVGEAASKGDVDMRPVSAPVEIGPHRLTAIDLRQLAALDVTGSVIGDQRKGRTQESEPFGLSTLRAPREGVAGKWRGVEKEMRADADILTRCRTMPDDCPEAAKRLLTIIDAARLHRGRARIGHVNRAINLAIRPATDMAEFGAADVWLSPLVTLAAGRGDCEDYAIAKYLALREAGIAEDDLRLVIVEDLGAREDHAVLAARLDGRWLILDNRHHTLADAMDVKHLRPLVAIDYAGVRRFAPVHAKHDGEAVAHAAEPMQPAF
jgi:predicted transglutaminase-like cysteine proteinase